MEKYESRGTPIPEKLWPPELLPGAEELLETFWELSTDRQVGVAAGPIPGAAIDRYAARMGVDGIDAHAEFTALVRAMDEAFLGKSAPQRGIGNLTDAKDGSAVKSLLRGFSAKRKTETERIE